MFRSRGKEEWLSVEDGLDVDFQIFSKAGR